MIGACATPSIEKWQLNRHGEIARSGVIVLNSAIGFSQNETRLNWDKMSED